MIKKPKLISTSVPTSLTTAYYSVIERFKQLKRYSSPEIWVNCDTYTLLKQNHFDITDFKISKNIKDSNIYILDSKGIESLPPKL